MAPESKNKVLHVVASPFAGIVTLILDKGLAQLGEERNSPAGRQPMELADVPTQQDLTGGAPVIGNRNSRVYHLPKGCPTYNQVGERNQVAFNSAAEAEAAGVRQAGNCR